MSWLPGWEKRIKLTFDNTNVDDTLSDFPVLIKLSDSSGISSTDVTSVFTELGSDANRKKIAVTISDEITQCYVEIERFDYSNSVAWLWVKAPSVASGVTTDLYLYYDSDQDDNTVYVGDTGDTPAQSVWDNNFKLVMHMSQDPNGDVADAIKDSTSNANHGTPAGAMTSDDLVDGKIGKAIDFDGGDDRIACGAGLENDPSVLTIELIAKSAGAASLYSHRSEATRLIQIYIQSTSEAKLQMRGSGNSLQEISKTGLDLTTLTYIAGIFDAVSDNHKLYVNNLTVETLNYDFGVETFTATQDNLATYYTGAVYGGYLLGQIDEFRISNTARSAAWIKATYYSNWDDLISFGDEEVVYYISGYVKEGVIPITRQIYAHNRDTGALITSTTSSGVGGYFYMETTYSGAHYVVCLDDAIGVDYNDLIYGNIYPVTISG